MKATALLLTICLMMLCLAACSGNDSSGGNNGGSADAATSNNTEPANANDSPGKNTGDQGAEQGVNDQPSGQGGDEQSSGPVKLVFAAFEPSELLQSAKKKYELAHPNVEIELQIAQNEFKDLDSQLANIDKFVTTTNTAMLSGKGPDLMELDLLPADKYVGKHLLVDYNDFMAQDETFKKDDYFVNILDNSQIGGGLYNMPLAFSVSGLIGDADAIEKAGVQVDDGKWSWEDFAATAKQLEQKGEYQHALASTPNYMLSEMVSENAPLFVDEASRKANFDSASFTGLMEQVKKMFDDGIVVDVLKGGKRSKVEEAYFQETQIQNPVSYLLTMDYVSGNPKLYTKPHAENMGEGGYFSTYKNIGINAGSPAKQEAWNFIKFLLEEEGQAVPSNSPNTQGFPISKKGYDNQMNMLRQEGTVPAFKDGPSEMDAFEIDAPLLDQLDAFLTGAVHSIGTQSKIDEIVSDESQAFFTGQKTAKDVAKLIQSKVSLYLNE